MEGKQGACFYSHFPILLFFLSSYFKGFFLCTQIYTYLLKLGEKMFRLKLCDGRGQAKSRDFFSESGECESQSHEEKNRVEKKLSFSENVSINTYDHKNIHVDIMLRVIKFHRHPTFLVRLTQHIRHTSIFSPFFSLTSCLPFAWAEKVK